MRIKSRSDVGRKYSVANEQQLIELAQIVFQSSVEELSDDVVGRLKEARMKALAVLRDSTNAE